MGRPESPPDPERGMTPEQVADLRRLAWSQIVTEATAMLKRYADRPESACMMLGWFQLRAITWRDQDGH